jgi:Fe/S biogenesis protein NfuA
MARIAEQVSVVTVTPEARQVVREALSQEPDPERLALWLEVRGVQQAQFVYDLYFQAATDASDDDSVFDDGELTVVVPKASLDRLRGARLEWNAEGEGGLVLVNPNTPAPEELGVPADVMAAGLDGPIGSRVSSVLEQAVNPSIAAHGGRADLVAMDESGGVAYLRLSGGCQGCAMSRMTLTQGIEAALREEVPEVTRVVDVTDHAGGANPYY